MWAVPLGDHAAAVRGGARVLSAHLAVRTPQRYGAGLLPAAETQASDTVSPSSDAHF